MGYFLRQTWANLQASWGIALQAVLVMSIAFLLLGAFGLLALQVESVLQHWEREAPVILYLKDKTTANQRSQLQNAVEQYQEVQRVRVVTAKQAMKRLRKALGKQGAYLDGLDMPVLPVTIEVDLKLWARNPRSLQQIKRGFSKLQYVHQVDVGQKWFAPLWELVRWVRIILFGGSALLLLSACLIAAGTIRLAIYTHRHEINIMRLLGATERFIRLPFFLEAILKGVLASSLALGVLYGAFLGVQSEYGTSFLAFTSIPMRFFDETHLALFLGGGLISGVVGSWLAFFTTSTAQERAS